MSDVFDPLFVECRTDARTLAMAIKGGGSLAQQEVRITGTSISDQPRNKPCYCV